MRLSNVRNMIDLPATLRAIPWMLLVILALAGSVHSAELKPVVEKQVEALTKDRPYATVVVGVLTGDRESVFAFGEHEGKTPDSNSVFEIGSATKTFTGILLADCVKRGLVKLDDPVQKYLPSGWTMPRRDDRDITLLQLATHTSGLPRLPNGFLAVMLKDPKAPYAKFDMEALKAGLPGTKITRSIGSKNEYSNLGIGLLGQALAHAMKAKNFEAAVSSNVLEPLGMTDTRITLTDGQKKRLFPGYDDKGKPQPNWDFACIEACGALRSTAKDMLKFVRANSKPEGELKEALVMSHQSWREISPGEESGLCWIRFVKKNPPLVIWHNGQTGGYHSFVGFIPGKGGVVVLCNVATGKVDKVGFEILKFIAEEK